MTQFPMEQAIETIRAAWRAGRSIVPIVGAGLSAESGVPILTAVVRYLAKFHQFLAKDAFLPPDVPGVDCAMPKRLKKWVEKCQKQPWEFVSATDWPDVCELNQDMLNRLEQTDPNDVTAQIQKALDDGLEEVLKRTNPEVLGSLQELKKAVMAALPASPEQVDPAKVIAAVKELYKKAGTDLPDGANEVLQQALTPDAMVSPAVEVAPGSATNGPQPQLIQVLIQAVTVILRGWMSKCAAAAGAAFEPHDGRHMDWELIGDWKRMIQFFTNYQGDYADALFLKLTAGHAPNLGHRFLAFLVRLLSIQTIFTFNFDEFIEQALQGEGIIPRVFAMEEGRGIPHHSLVRDAVSVIKLHGTNHALLLDERVDHPLSDDYKKRFRHLVGPDPLLLVIGCSGGDFRLRDLVDHVLHWEPPKSKTRAAAAGPEHPRVVWLHFEKVPPRFIKEFGDEAEQKVSKRLLAAPTNHPGASLQHLYSALAGRHPASPIPYPVLPTKPVLLPVEPRANESKLEAAVRVQADRERSKAVEQYLNPDNGSFVICSNMPVAGEVAGPSYASTSDTLLRLADLGTRWGYHLVWVDLESVHTIAGVVGTVIDQCRKYDPNLPPSVLPLSEDPEVIGRACDRIRHALRRSKYLVILDGLETYTWRPTIHHGDFDFDGPPRGDRLTPPIELLNRLAEAGTIGNSVVVLGIEAPKGRSVTARGPTSEELLQHLHRSDGRQGGTRGWVNLPIHRPAARPGRDDRYFEPDVRSHRWLTLPPTLIRLQCPMTWSEVEVDRWAVILLTLCCFRRSRPLAALRHLLRPFLGGRADVDRVLNALTSDPSRYGALRLEGGVVWLNRNMRDQVYAWNTQFVERPRLEQCLSGDVDPVTIETDIRAAAAQSFLLTTMHQRISRFYYTRTFVQSQDTTAFLEHVYHRISSIRYLVKFLGLLRKHPPLVLAAVRESGHLLRRAAAPDQFDELRRRLEIDEKSMLDQLAFEDGSIPDESKVRTELENRHLNQVSGLHRAWVRAESLLRAQQPAEQLVEWCDAILNSDTEHGLNRVRLLGPPGATPAGARYHNHEVDEGFVNPRAKAAIQGFRKTLNNFRVKLQIERSDYSRALSDRRDDVPRFQAADDAGPLPVNPKAIVEADPRMPTMTEVHALLDVSLCYIKRGLEYEEPNRLEDADGLNVFIGTTLDQYEGPIEEMTAACSAPMEWGSLDWPTPDRSGGGGGRALVPEALQRYSCDELSAAGTDFQEARLRLENMKFEVALGCSTIFADPTGFVGDCLPDRLRTGRDVATTAADKGLMLARHQDSRVTGPLHSVVLEPTPDGSFYLQYRSNFHTLRGRVEWLWAFEEDGTVKVPAEMEDAFEGAYRHFDLARGGLGTTNRVMVALTELCMAEACLAHARILLHPKFQSVKAVPARLAEAQAKYESARFALLRARDALLAGRRNVIWWKLYLLLAAQYQSDRLQHTACRLFANGYDPDAPAAPPSGLLVRLRRGYTVVKGALDYQLPTTAHGRATPAAPTWLRRVWAELSLGALAVGNQIADTLAIEDKQYPEGNPSAF